MWDTLFKNKKIEQILRSKDLYNECYDEVDKLAWEMVPEKDESLREWFVENYDLMGDYDKESFYRVARHACYTKNLSIIELFLKDVKELLNGLG